MPTALMPGWIRHVAAFNPVNWSLEAARAGLLAKPDWTNLAVHGGWLLALAVLMVWLATYSFRGVPEVHLSRSGPGTARPASQSRSAQRGL